jgi:peptide/nickel transport system permease protein
MADVTVGQSGDLVTKLSGEHRREAESMLRMVVRRFLRHRMAVAGTVILTLIVFFAIGGAIIYSEDVGNRPNPRDRFLPPSVEHPFGTDQVGRSVLIRMVYGGQISLMIGVLSAFIAVTIGTTVGLASGYFGGWLDSILMRIVEALLAIPTLIFLLLLSGTLARNTDTLNILGRQLSFSVVAIVLIIGLLGWMGLSRIVRSMVLSLKEQEFVLAARTIGARNQRIIITHILPNCLAPIIVAATLGVGAAIIAEAYLSFLGFGVLPPTATWGNILTRAQEQVSRIWWMWMFPGAFITLTVLSINFIGDGLRDALDPRSLK